MSFEVVEFTESTPQPGHPFLGTQQRVLATFESEAEAIELARSEWHSGQASGTRDVMWWIVRVPGEELCRWIADRGSNEEQILDLTTNTLVSFR